MKPLIPKLIKSIVAIAFLFIGCPGRAQPNELILRFFSRDLSRIEPHFVFLEKEMIEFCGDSIGQAKFDKAFKRTERNTNKTEGDIQEYKLLYNMLYKRIKSVNVKTNLQKQGKDFLERKLGGYKVDFNIDDKLLLERFDFQRRDIAHGYPECSVGKSMLIFLIYDPILYKNVFVKNKSISKNGTVFLPFYCTLQDEGTPLSIRKVLQTELVALLSKFNDPELALLMDQIKNCNLEDDTHD